MIDHIDLLPPGTFKQAYAWQPNRSYYALKAKHGHPWVGCREQRETSASHDDRFELLVSDIIKTRSEGCRRVYDSAEIPLDAIEIEIAVIDRVARAVTAWSILNDYVTHEWIGPVCKLRCGVSAGAEGYVATREDFVDAASGTLSVNDRLQFVCKY